MMYNSFYRFLQVAEASQVMLSGKEHACQYRRHKRCGFDSWVGKIVWRRAWQRTPYSCLEKRSLAGCIVHGVAKTQRRLKRLSTYRLLEQVVLFANILLRILIFLLMSDTGLYFLFLYCPCSVILILPTWDQVRFNRGHHPPQNASFKTPAPRSMVSRPFVLLNQLATNWGFPLSPQICQNTSQNSEKCFTQGCKNALSFIRKDANQDSLRVPWGELWQSPNCKTFVASGCTTLSHVSLFHRPGKLSPSFGCPGVFLGLHFMGMIDCVAI